MVLSLVAVGILLLETFVRRERKIFFAHLTIGGFVVAALFLRNFSLDQSLVGFSRMLVQDGFALIFKWLFLLVGVLAVLVSYDYLRARDAFRGEFFALLIFSTVGMMLVASSYDFMTLFVGLELASLATYILVGITKKDLWSNEAAIKYFLLSIFASAILLFGLSVVYAAVGTVNFEDIAEGMSSAARQFPGMAVAALVLIVAGFGFKITAAPFHMYAPDVYQGAPTPVTIFLAVGPKAAAFAGFLRVLVCLGHPVRADWLAFAWVLAVLTMTVGNVAAVLQTNVKRMLAYSSIAHAGYILIGVAAMARERGTDGAMPSSEASVVLYLFAYIFMNVGAFSLLMYMKREHGFGEELADFSGLGRRRPAVATAMLVLLLSLAGIPLTLGFWGKFYIFMAAIRTQLYWLAVIGVINVVISLFYYARIVVHMFMRTQERAVSDVRSLPLNLALGITAVATIVLGIFPEAILSVIERSASSIFMGGILQ